jgi:3-hydroxyisobutyrate dehydrogenase-like beta-hydroxyacid dehydrogenase
MTTRNIAWIGAGKMGLPICRRLKAAGHNVHVLVRSADAQKKHELLGLTPHANIASLVKNADVVFSSISDDAAFRDIVLGTNNVGASLPKGHIFIDISTISPTMSAEVAENLKSKGIHYLRSPVSGSTLMAEAGTLTAVVSGPKATFDAVQSLYECFTKKAIHVGENEEARYLKLVLNSMVAATSALLAEALAFGQQGGLDNTTMLSVINQSVVAAPLIAYKTDMIIKQDFRPAATLSMLQKDLKLFLDEASAKGVQMPLGKHIHDIYQAASARGLGESDFFVLVQDALNQSKVSH